METVRVVDLDVTEREELEKVVQIAKSRGAYLHIEVRKI